MAVAFQWGTVQSLNVSVPRDRLFEAVRQRRIGSGAGPKSQEKATIES